MMRLAVQKLLMDNSIHQGKPAAAKTPNHVNRNSCMEARADDLDLEGVLAEKINR